MQAAKVLAETLYNGTVTLKSGKKIPIAGDTTRLPLADGLTPVQKRMAWNMHTLCKNQPGTQQLRQQMGHAEFGARVVYGDCLFYTMSPNEQHSAWVLRLSRYRSNDPCIQSQDEVSAHLRACAGRLSPSVAHADSVRARVGLEAVDVELPAYKLSLIHI